MPKYCSYSQLPIQPRRPSNTAAQPVNFYTLQVDTLTGKAKVIRP